ncbi:hypothetical protein ACQRWP_15740 [Micromonospora trifolii]|uniref:hypothetical protein n=1 Tax=Micromonospora trifolii TaxID=2911208 RepID=UPI003D2EC0FB
MALDSGKGYRFWTLVVTNLAGIAMGISVNGLHDDYGWTAAGACAAAAGATALLVRLRRLPPRAPLVRLMHRVFLALAFATLVVGAFGSGSTARYALPAAAGAVIVVLVTTPGVRLLETLFRVAMIGVAVGYLSTLLPEWNRSDATKALIVGGLVVLANVYLVGRDHGFAFVAEFFAAPRPHLAIQPLGGGTAMIILGVAGFFEAGPMAPAIFGSLGLAGVAVGLCLLKGGPHAGAIAVTVTGVATIVIGAAFSTMRGGALVGVALIILGVSLAGRGLTRTNVLASLQAFGRRMVQDPDTTS